MKTLTARSSEAKRLNGGAAPTPTEKAFFAFREENATNPAVVSIEDCSAGSRDHKLVYVTLKSLIGPDAESLYKRQADLLVRHPSASIDIRVTD
jgi:hypothetical protein